MDQIGLNSASAPRRGTDSRPVPAGSLRVAAAGIRRPQPGRSLRLLLALVAAPSLLLAGWTPTHEETGRLGDRPETQAAELSSFCLDGEDNLLACDERGQLVRKLSPDNQLLASWKLPFGPQAIARRSDGSVLVAGQGNIALLDAKGQVAASAKYPAHTPDRGAVTQLNDEQFASWARRHLDATAVAATGDDLFVCAKGKSGYTLYRTDPAFSGFTPVLRGLQGCCGQMDVTARDGAIYVAANCDAKVVRYDREGKKLGEFGQEGKDGDDPFVGCCEPKNLCVGPDGSLYVSESQRCLINRFSPDGKRLAFVGAATGITGCVRVTVGVNRDASRVYLLDTDKHQIRVLALKTANH